MLVNNDQYQYTNTKLVFSYLRHDNTTPMKRLMCIMLDHNKLFIITVFYSLP